MPAHRLDRDTSGCLVLARHPRARSRLGRLFEAGRIGKVYWAIVSGEPEEDSGTIEAALSKRNERSGWRVVVDAADGRPAATDWRVLGRAEGSAWLELRPRTGRTHQIRVHLTHAGWPIVGDTAYGGPSGALLLHARSVEVPYWLDRPPIIAEAPAPEAFAKLAYGFR